MTTWVTFVPCFLWIFLGAPYVEGLRHNRYLNASLSTISAAVVGVILNLAVWFGVHVLFQYVNTLPIAGLKVLVPVWASLDLPALALALIAAIALLRLRIGVIWTVTGCGLLSAAAEIATLM